jgi:hypothetical protein
MNRFRVFACSLFLLLATLPTGIAVPRSMAAAANCGYAGSFEANTEVQQGVYVWDINLSITDKYIPATDVLKFTVTVSISQGNDGCTSSFGSASGTIGIYSFTMSPTKLKVGGSTFPVTATGTIWSASGSLSGVTGFSCTTWTTMGQASGTSGANGPDGCQDNGVSTTGPATLFSCTCE